MSYAYLFENPVSERELPADIMIDVSQFTHDERAVLLKWLRIQVDRAAAEARLRDVLRQARFDVIAAELGATLHEPGNV